jgi:hypothetical protein
LKGRKHKRRLEQLKKLNDNLKRKQEHLAEDSEDRVDATKKTKQDQEPSLDSEKANSSVAI